MSTQAAQTKNSQRTNRSNGPDFKETASEIGENLRDAGVAAKDYAQGVARDASDRAKDTIEAGKSCAMTTGKRVEQYVKDQPLKAIAIAAGAGLLLGLFGRK